MQGKPVEWLTDPRRREITTGRKRNDLIQQASGAWVCFVDDDDNISGNYVDLILQALESNPDVVTFEGWMTTNGAHRVDWVIKLGERYEERGGMYYRFPNHLCCVRKSIAINYKFPNITQGEDFEWAKKLNDAKLVDGVWISGPNPVLNTSVHITDKIYHYDYNTSK